MTRPPQQCVVAVYKQFDAASDAVRRLGAAGIDDQYVSLVTHDVAHQVPHGETMQSGDLAEKRAAQHAGVGGVLGLLLGAPLVMVPGLGPVLWAAPMLTGMTGAIVGGLVGTMQGWGVHEDHIRKYEQQIRQGGLLVVVNGPPDTVADAQQVLSETTAESVHLHARTGDDSPEIDDRKKSLHS